MCTPRILGIPKGIHPPKGGWRPRSYYIVVASFGPDNPFHEYVYFTGFLQDGKPAGYNCFPNTKSKPSISEAYFVEAKKFLCRGDDSIVDMKNSKYREGHE